MIVTKFAKLKIARLLIIVELVNVVCILVHALTITMIVTGLIGKSIDPCKMIVFGICHML